MKKFLLSSSVVILFALYVYKTFGTPVAVPTTEPTTDASAIPPQNTSTNFSIFNDDDNDEEDEDDDDLPASYKVVPTPTPIEAPPVTTQTAPATTNTTTTPAPKTTALYKDGTFTGPVVDAFYGNIQVQVKIAGGKITNVVFLQYPNDQENSIKVNTRAMPILKSEIIAAQSANINVVSGASASSPATIKSVMGALALAKN